MMKSFFKKLAFVMALAMVVTLAAPAATASAADALGIVLQDDATWTVLEKDELAVDATVDYRYKGAPKNFKELDPTWSSSDETVATVDKNGLVKGLKDGVATIKIALSNGQEGSIEVTVGKGAKVDNAFTVTQKTSNTVEIVFADKDAATKDITVTKLGKTTAGTVTEIVWPVNKVELKDNKATVTVWVDFGNSDFRFTANEVSVDKTMAVGDPDFAVITYKNAYTYADNDNKACTPEIAVYDANGVQLTGYTNWYFELLNTDANAYVENTTGNLYLWSVGAVANIKATLTYVVGTETKKVECPVKVTCVAKPAYTVNNYVEKYALVAPGTATDKITWGKTDVIINNVSGTDKTYKVAAIIKDSLDKTNSISAVSVDDKNPLLKDYYVRYASSNPSVALIDDVTGEVLGVNVGKAYALVTLYKKATQGQDTNIGVIAAIPVDVCAAKKATIITLDKYTDTLLTSGDFTKTTVTVTVKDQYQNDYSDPVKSVYAKVNDVEYSNSTGYVTIDGNKFTIDAKKFAGVNVNSISFEVKTNSGLKATYVLTIKKLPEKVNEMFALKVDGANVALGDAFDGTANVGVVSAWAGNSYLKTAFYWGKPATCKVGDLYVTVTGPDGKDITSTKTATDMALTFNAITSDTATAEALTTMATGTYIVKLNQVTQVATGTDDKQIVNTVLCDTKTFEIKNSLPGVTDFKVKSNTCVSLTDPIDATTVDFKVNGKEWKNTDVTVLSVNAKSLDNSVYVYDFTVKIPYGNNGAYYTKKVTVNQLFTK